jgi:preprotein translocase subunit SecB
LAKLGFIGKLGANRKGIFMTDDKKATPAAPAAGKEPSIQIIAQYTKDFSFENPHAPESLVSGWPAPETNVEVALGQAQLKEGLFECGVNFRVEAKNKKDNRVAFIAELHYAAMVALHNIPKENIQPILMVEVPKLLFPFIREIIASAVAQGGFPPLYLSPISFEAIYINEVKRQQTEGKTKAKA